MELYIAPPRGKKEKESYLAWVTELGFTPIWLDLRRKVKGPLLYVVAQILAKIQKETKGNIFG